MPRIIGRPPGKDWRHRSRAPLVVRRYASKGRQAVLRTAHLVTMRWFVRGPVPGSGKWSRCRGMRAAWRYLAMVGAALFLFWFSVALPPSPTTAAACWPGGAATRA
ncbi:hypothetical protein [Streptomyces mashuensis]|nr:hypothetical protein [Streptomyces mashuensis]